MPLQNLINFSLFLKIIVCTISARSSSNLGETSYPKFSKILLAKIAVFRLLATTVGAKNNPFK